MILAAGVLVGLTSDGMYISITQAETIVIQESMEPVCLTYGFDEPKCGWGGL